MKLSHCVPDIALLTACLLTGCGKSQESTPPQAAQAAQPPVDAAETIYTAGEIVTVNDKQPSAEALAVKGGKIVAVGTRADVEKAHAQIRGRDLGGKALLPAFLDAHKSHYISSSVANGQPVCTTGRAGKGPRQHRRRTREVPRSGAGRARLLHGAVLNCSGDEKVGSARQTLKTPPGASLFAKPGTQEPYGLIMETALPADLRRRCPQPTKAQEVEWSKAGQMIV